VPEENERRERLRFDDFRLDRFPNGRCKAQVGLQWTRGRSYTGEAEGTQTKQGELQAAAQAALAAATESVEGRVALELRGIKAVRAFDAWVVVASVSARIDNLDIRLLGAFPIPGPDISRGAVLAVLDATNRVLQRYLVE
jgi:hypothetical protein